MANKWFLFTIVEMPTTSVQVVPVDVNGSKNYVKVIVKNGRSKQETIMTKAQFKKKMASMEKLRKQNGTMNTSNTNANVQIDPSTGLQGYKVGLGEYIKAGFGIELGALLAEGLVDVVADGIGDAVGWMPDMDFFSFFGGSRKSPRAKSPRRRTLRRKSPRKK